MVINEKAVGSSNVSDMDPMANRHDGTDADWFAARMAERLTAANLRRSDGVSYPVVSGRIDGCVFLSMGFSNAEVSNTHDELIETVRRTPADMGLSGTVE